MLGPKNKVLRKDFLLQLIDNLKKFNLSESKDSIKVPNWSDFYDLHWSRDFYELFIKQQNTIIYNGESFKILSMALSNNKKGLVDKTYKDIWKSCDKVDPSTLKTFETHHCDCEDNYNEDDEKAEAEVRVKNEIEIYSINKFLKEYENKLTYNGTYYSQPGPYYPVAGAQYKWNMIFNYNEIIDSNPFDICVKLGPSTRNIFVKQITSYTGHPLTGIIESGNKNVDNYIPNNLYFDSDFFPIIKNALINRDKVFEYNDIKYKIIDCKFCDVKSDVFSCGCCPSMCRQMSKTQGQKKIPCQISYRDSITVSCTPEWYIQVQIGCCNSGSYCARFILECL